MMPTVGTSSRPRHRFGRILVLWLELWAAAAFAQSPTPVAWFKADAITGVSQGSHLATWMDASGNGYHATQASGSQQPVFVTNVLNGLPAVRFTSANSTFLTFPRPVRDDFTLVCVFRSTQGLNTGTLYYQGAGLVSGEVAGVTTDFGSCLFADGRVCAGTGSPDTALVSAAGYNDGQPHVFTLTRTESAGEIALWVDGAAEGFTLGSTAALTAPAQLALGAQLTGGNYFSGDLGEVQVFTNALADAPRRALEATLAVKYGLIPPAPTALTAQLINGQPTLNWTGSGFAAHYHVKRGPAASGPFTLIGDTTNTVFADTGASLGQAACYAISALNAAHNEGANSPVATLPSTLYTLRSGPAVLLLRSNNSQWDLVFQLTNGLVAFQQPSPLAVDVVSSSGAEGWRTSPYTGAQDLGNGVLRCTGTVASANGSRFTFSDTYRVYDTNGAFQIDRTASVSSPAAGDAGYATKLTFQRSTPGSMTDCDFLLPAVWYQTNAAVTSSALANTLTDDYYWCREDRLPLPLVMLRQRATGATFSVTHKSPDGSSYAGEDYLNRLIDSRLQFAALGLENKTQPAVGLLFPGTEGQRTLILGGSTNKQWALRAHPVTAGFAQNYSVVVRLGLEPDFPTALKDTWNAAFAQFNPAVYPCDLTAIYTNALQALTRYWTNINGAAGEPFRVPWRTGVVTNLLDYNYDLGFVGMQLPNAAILIREGFNTTNAPLRAKGEQMADWWAAHCLTASGCPKTWYDPYPQTWRTYPTYLRVACDGMLGLLWAWNQEQWHGVSKAAWLTACTTYGDWILSHQNADGSIPRGFDYASNQVTDPALSNTSHAIRYLVELYLATHLTRFQQAALNAGSFVYTISFQSQSYLGGAVDNGNVPDKEAASMALRAATALYDLTLDSRWLDAAAQAAAYYATWVYAWNVPLPSGDAAVVYPVSRSTTGLGAIATANSGVDAYAATDAFEFYRLYLATGDTNLLNEARLLLYNTKQGLNWDAANPLTGFGDPGISAESLTLSPQRGHGVDYYLPWQTANYLEPMIDLKDVFGAYDINTLEQLPLPQRQGLNHAFAANRNYLSAQTPPAAPGGLAASDTGGALSLRWSAAATALFYNLKRATNSGGPYQLVASQTATTWTDTSVTIGAPYYYVVSALNAGGEGVNSAPVAAMAQVPGLTANLAPGGGQITVSWSGWAATYKVYGTTNLAGATNWLPVGGSPGLSNGVWSMTLPLDPDHAWFFRLQEEEGVTP